MSNDSPDSTNVLNSFKLVGTVWWPTFSRVFFHFPSISRLSWGERRTGVVFSFLRTAYLGIWPILQSKCMMPVSLYGSASGLPSHHLSA